MKINEHSASGIFGLALLYFLALIIWSGSVLAQNSEESQGNHIYSPAEEKFQKANDLVSPWRSSGCNLIYPEFREPGCYFVRDDVWRKSDILTLYNADGTVWYRFSLTYQSPDYFLKDTKMGFIPFATPYGYSGSPQIVLLRMTSESADWYEVEVNENTRATKFVLKSDPMWATTKWSYWLYESGILRLRGKHSLLDKPNGDVIKETSGYEIDKVKLLKVEGDWAYVGEFGKVNDYHGWVRWRKGRDILVVCLYNDNNTRDM